MTFEFDRATELAPLGSGRFGAKVHDGWDIGGAANGGYLLALVSSALCHATERKLPVAISCHYLAPINDAEVVIETSLLKSGKSFATASATMRQGERIILSALGTCADSLPPNTRQLSTHQPPNLPTFDQATQRRETTAGQPGLMKNVDIRLHPVDTGFAVGAPSGQALVRGWCAFRDGRQVDPLALTLFCDAFPPAVFNLSGAPGWVPTVQLSFYLRGIPDGQPVAGEFVTREIHNGLFEEDGSLWNAAGELVAQSRQVAMLPR